MSSSKIFIAELHDIGKLVDRQALKQQYIQIISHTFHDFCFLKFGIPEPSSPSWYAQYLEEGVLKKPHTDLLNFQEAINKIPDPQTRADVLLTKMADGISAAISRLDLYGMQIHKGQASESIYKLWNGKYWEEKRRSWSPFTDINSLKEMFQYIDSCLSHQDFFKKYGEYLSRTPEDKTAPGNIVSLYKHLELVGKIYRTLKRHSVLRMQNKQFNLLYNNQAIKSVIEASGNIDPEKEQGKWIFRLVYCHFNFPQSFARLQDLNVFRKRTDLIKSFSEDDDTKDYVLFFTDDFMCLFIPRETEVRIQQLLSPFLEAGFIIDLKEMEAELNLLTSSMERAFKKVRSKSTARYLRVYEKRLTSDLPTEFFPPLCDSCQLRQGKERIKDQIREYLCDICNEIRKMGEPAREFAKWDEKELSAGWIKITLDQEQLLRTIHRLFEDYVDSHQLMQSINDIDKNLLKDSFRPLSVQMDFVNDFKKFLECFKDKIYEVTDKDGRSIFTREDFLFPIAGYHEFGIFKVYSSGKILPVVDLFYDLLKHYFPDCQQDSPIKLSISLAPVKYPYQEHWRFLSLPKNCINIQSPLGSKLEIDNKQYNLLREKIKEDDTRLSHFLHYLSSIETKTRSSMQVMLEILNNRKRVPALLELIQNGLSVNQILTFYKLTKEMEVS